jgi:hypothetical protein
VERFSDYIDDYEQFVNKVLQDHPEYADLPLFLFGYISLSLSLCVHCCCCVCARAPHAVRVVASLCTATNAS